MQFDCHGRLVCVHCGGVLRQDSTNNKRTGRVLEVAFQCPDCQRSEIAVITMSPPRKKGQVAEGVVYGVA